MRVPAPDVPPVRRCEGRQECQAAAALLPVPLTGQLLVSQFIHPGEAVVRLAEISDLRDR